MHRMRSFLQNKLVRDNIVQFMEDEGQKPIYRMLNDDEYIQALAVKLLEESKEINIHDTSTAVKELADVLEVLESLAVAFGSSLEHIQKIQLELRAKRGGFDKRVYISRVDLQDGDKWIDYYESEPEKFKEVS